MRDAIPNRNTAGAIALRYVTSAAAVCAVLGATACATPTPPPPGEVTDTYRVGAPDLLSVTILPEPVTQTDVMVRPDGMISIPLVGDVIASGRTIDEISKDIEQRVSRFKRNASVSVALRGAASTDITILGEVGGPSAFPLVRSTRIVEALGEVGGPTRFAATGRIRVIRTTGGQTTVLKVKLNDIQRGDLSTNVLLMPGDIIYVPPSIMATIGYAIESVLFPFQPFLGIAYGAAGSALR